MVWRVLIASFFAGMGLRLNWLFLNFYLEDTLNFGRELIGYANAAPAVSMVVLGIPAGILAPRIGYVVGLRIAGVLAAIGLVLVGWAPSTIVVFAGLLIFGLGNSLTMATTAPLLQRLAPPDMRVKAFSWSAALGTSAGFFGSAIGGYLPDLIGGLRGLVFLMAGIFVLMLVPLGTLSAKDGGGGQRFVLRNPKLWLKLLIPNAFISLGAGAIMPFLNLFLSDKFDLSFAEIGWVFALSALATTTITLFQPALVTRFGKVGAIVISQAMTLPFILVLGFAPWIALVAVAMLVREALMNAVNPIAHAFAMEILAEEEGAAYMIIQGAMWRVGWAISSSFSGQLQARLGVDAFSYLFAGMFCLYLTGILLTVRFWWPYLVDVRKRIAV